MMSASVSIGISTAALSKTIRHVSQTSFEYTGQAFADLPTIRAYVAKMQVKLDMAKALLADTLGALENARKDGMLRVLEVKAAAGEVSLEVTDVAMRVCGGTAFRTEVGIKRNFRDARAATVINPTIDLLYGFIGKAVCGLPLF